jgi:hypothetical protein
VHVPVSQLMHRPDLGVGQRLLVIRGCRRSRSFSWAVNSVPCSRLPSLSEFSLISARYKMILNWPDWERDTHTLRWRHLHIVCFQKHFCRVSVDGAACLLQ